jgi:UDP-N-acetylmuramoyl-tripeptide--D-alanyl-D-alanine ligase
MNDWAFEDLADVMNGRWHIKPQRESAAFVGASIDTRSTEPGQIFFAFVGDHVDGHQYLEAARQAGASVCVVTHSDRVPEEFELPVLVVENPLNALTELALAWRAKLSCKVIAITGSNGKTTSCRLMHAICARAGMAYVSPKSFNNALGVPLTILNTPIDADYLVAEVGMSTPGEIAARTKTLRPDIAIITSIGRAHLQALGSIENIAKEKAQVIAATVSHTIGVIPAGIEPLERALCDDKHMVVRLGDGLEMLASSEACSNFRLDGNEYSIPMPGDHNASNAALCVLAAQQLGIESDTIRAGIASVTPPEMRFERIELATDSDPIVVINDAYNANPDSMRAAIATFAQLNTSGRRVVVLGEMLELGSTAAQEHQTLAAEVLGRDALDQVILVGDSYTSVTSSIKYASDEQGIEQAAALISPGDTVLIKGSRGVRLERLIDKLGEIHASCRSNGKETAPSDA